MANRKRVFPGLTMLGLLICAGLAVTAAITLPLRPVRHTPPAKTRPAPIHDAAPIRLARPDALIVSSSLRDLPRDLLKVPLLKTLLTEKFVFYYQRNSTLLGIKGTLRRIAYEHHLTLRDDLIAMVLDRPADVALWRGRNGSLGHWLIDTAGKHWLAWMKLAARLAGKDVAIKKVGTLPLAGGAVTPVYRFDYGRPTPVYFASAHGHVVLFSDLDMIRGKHYGRKAQRARFWQALLRPDRKHSPLRSHFGMSGFTGKHALVVSAKVVSFNYQHFTPSIKALRFDFDGTRWVSYVQLAPHSSTLFDNADLWHALPDDAAMCAAAPVDWSRLAPVIGGIAKRHDNQAIHADVTRAFGHQAAVCWFADGSIYTPLFVARFADTARFDPTLKALFQDVVGNSYGRYRQADHKDAAHTITMAGAARAWQNPVPTDYGRFRVTLARTHAWLVFSPDARTVTRAVTTIQGNRPAWSDHFADEQGEVLAVVTPARLVTLLTNTIQGDFKADRQPLFHSVASERLLPRLDAAARFPAFALRLPPMNHTTQRTWQPVTWHVLPGKH